MKKIKKASRAIFPLLLMFSLILSSGVMMIFTESASANGKETIFKSIFKSNTWSDGWELENKDSAWNNNGGNNNGDNAECGKKYAENNQGGWLKKEVSTEGYENITLQFSYKINFKEDDKEVKVEWYDGSDWENLKSYNYSDNTNTDGWKDESIDLSSGADDKSDFAFRFDAPKKNGNGNKYEFKLDCVKLLGDKIDDGDIDNEKISPILECVEELGTGEYKAHFSYETHNNVDVTIEVGEDNKFTGGGTSNQDQGQTTLFKYPAPNNPGEGREGRTGFYPDNPFYVDFNGSELVWTLKGPDGNTRTATASENSKRCPVEESVTISATKIVCEYEEYLPDWVKDKSYPSKNDKIDEGTAQEFLNDISDEEGREVCWLEEDWDFEWGYNSQVEDQLEEGDHIGEAVGSGWKEFNSKTTASDPAIATINDLSVSNKIWVREILKNGYIPFAHPNPGWEGSDEMESAEIACHADGWKYDNGDIINTTFGATYHCVAFNVPKTRDVKVCKENDEEEKLGDWDVFLEYKKTGLLFEDTTINDKEDNDYGCVTFENVPYGEYELGEELKGGWERVDDKTEVEVDEETGEFTIKNKEKVDEVTVNAYKVVCEDEEDLPDWAKDKNNPFKNNNPLTKEGIDEYIENKNCEFVSDWDFEWGEATANKIPGHHYGWSDGYNDDDTWEKFDTSTDADGKATVVIPYPEEKSHFWVREVLKEGYIPFSDDERGEESVSAEMLCHVDGYKYDNYDRIDNPEANEEYTCVAFNVPETTDVEVCKMDDMENSLEGWDVVLASPDSIFGPEEINVLNEEGTDSISLPEGYYLIGVNGTYRYGSSSMNADAGYSYRPTGIPDGCDCWYSGFDLSSASEGLMAWINEEPTYWGPFDSEHTYTLIYHHEDDNEPINVSIFDDIYGDNVNDNNFSFEIFEVMFQGETGEEGCITFEDVPLRDYILDEENREGWENLEGLGVVSVDDEEKFVIVNKEEESKVVINAYKVVCEDEGDLPDWAKNENNPGKITKNLVDDYVDGLDNGSCWFESDWDFEWGYDGKAEKLDGGETGYAGTDKGWEPFDLKTGENEQPAVAMISDLTPSSQIWVREVLKKGYIPFTDADTEGEESVSAEMLCHTDGWKYDNYDYVKDAEKGETYTCVAFNVPDCEDVVVVSNEEDLVDCLVDQESVPASEPEISTYSLTNAVLAWVHDNWTQAIESASWIWGTEKVTDPVNGEMCHFEKEFDVNGTVSSAKLEVAADNSYTVRINGDTAGGSSDKDNFSEKDEYEIGPEFFEDEDNKIEFEVENCSQDGGTQESNPAGLLYRLEIKRSTCDDSVTYDPGIILPEKGDVLCKDESLDLKAKDVEASDGGVDWAVRFETCEKGEGAVAGNVDGYSDSYDWEDGIFDAKLDVSGWSEGEYCFVFNPKNGGRYTRLFDVDDCEEEEEEENEDDDNHTSGSNIRSGVINDPGVRTASEPEGEVLGETDENEEEKTEEGDEEEVVESCGIYLNEYIKYGADNNPEEVKKLQTFLNEHMGEDLPVTGFYGEMTRNAVNRFQLKYKEEVLRPWVEVGVHENENEPTGYVYQTTKRWINMIVCPELNIPMPDLSGYIRRVFSSETFAGGSQGEVLGGTDEEEDWTEEETGETLGEEDEGEKTTEETEEDKENERNAGKTITWIVATMATVMLGVVTYLIFSPIK